MGSNPMPPHSAAADDRALVPRTIEAVPAAAVSEPTPLQVALRHKWPILALALLAAAAMQVALGLVPPTFVAEADLRIDMPPLRGVTDDNTSLLRAEPPSVELLHTEMAALTSPRLALAAVQALGLETLPGYRLCPPQSLPDQVRDLIGRLRGAQGPAPACAVSPEHAAKTLLSAMSFVSDRASYIIQIVAGATDPALAARIANGYAEAYIASQRSLKASLAQQADAWLAADLARMQAQMLADDAAAEAYRQQHRLIGLHPGADGSDGAADTVATQQLAQRTADLGAIDTALAEKTSTLAQMDQATRDGHLDAIAPVLGSPLIQTLIARQADLSATLAQLRGNYGPTYPAVAAAAAAQERAEAQVRAEADRIAHGLRGEVAALDARRAAVAAEIAALQNQVAGESRDSVDLAELRRTAATDRRIYESLFVRLRQIEAEQRMQQPSAAIAVEATPPDAPSSPRARMMVAGTFLAALGTGIGVAFGAETMSRRFRDGEQMEGEVGLPVIGVFARRRRAPQDMAIDRPLSVEAEAVQSVLTHLLGTSHPNGAPLGRVVMVTSALPGEGKSCLSVALGRSAMRAGLSAVVLDCDVRRPAVGRLLAGRPVLPPETRLAWPEHDAFHEPRDPREAADLIAEAMRRAGNDDRSGLLHLSMRDHVADPHRLLAWPGFAGDGLLGLLSYLRARHDLVLLDTPPVLAVADALRLGGLADEVVLAVDWTGTPRQAVLAAVRTLQRARLGVTGLVMTKVDLRRYARAHGGDIYARAVGVA